MCYNIIHYSITRLNIYDNNNYLRLINYYVPRTMCKELIIMDR